MNNILLTILFTCGTLFFFSNCNGQVKSTNSTTTTTQEQPAKANGKIVTELPTAIWSIHQDKKNNYWFGGNGTGVFFFNGETYTQFTTEDGLADNQIREILEDKAGNIYFDTPSGTNKYDGQQISTLQAVYSDKNEWKSEPDDLWFKGNGDINGVYRYDGKELYHLKFPEYDIASAYGYKEENPSYSPYGVYSVYKDKRGQLWFGTLSSGVYAYQGEQSFWISEKELGTLDDGRVPGVRSILEDKDGNFWLSNILGRYRMHEVNSDTNLTRYEKLPGIQVPEGAATMELPYFMSAVTDDENGDLWMLTYSEGIWRYDGESFINYQVMDGDKEVLLFKLYKDREGTIWVGTHEAGIYRWNGEGFVPANSFATSNKRRKE